MNVKTNNNKIERPYGVASNPEHLPAFSVSQEQVEAAQQKLFGTDDERYGVSPAAIIGSEWARLFDQFYRERVVYVRSNETLLLRFSYNYEIDLDRINSATDLLCWALHLCGKTWMSTEHLRHFIEAVGAIKKLKIYGL
jgi:hypothetical protein